MDLYFDFENYHPPPYSQIKLMLSIHKTGRGIVQENSCEIIEKKFDTSTLLCDSILMTAKQIITQIELDKAQLQMWKGRMEQSEINWLNARIAELKAMLPGARHNDKVNAFGFASVERNA
jgi:hypothetical protein